MQQIHLIKAAQAIPFVKVLENIDAPVRSFSIRAGMPIDAVYAGEGVIGEYSVWQFIEIAAKYERYNLFGYDVAQQYPIESAEGLGGLRMRNAPSLKVLLEYFIEDVQAESTGCPYSLVPDTDGMWFVREQMFGKRRKSWQAEQYMIAIIIQIIRLCTGPTWLPPALRISSTAIAQKLPDEWKQINITWGCEVTEIRIPECDLALPPANKSRRRKAEPPNLDKHETKAPLEFPELVKTQVLTNSIGLEAAAMQTGVSPKTLKRKLADMKTTYSEIVDQVRMQLAKSKLEESNAPIHLIAKALGYKHQANFTRAFKRICGISPQDYRNKHQA